MERKLSYYLVIFGLLILELASCRKEIFYNGPGKYGGGNYIPLTLRYNYSSTQNEVTAIATIYVNGVPVQVMFDTGSSGLRITKGSVLNAGYSTTNLAVGYGYGNFISGINIRGVVASANLSFSSASKGAPVNFMVVESSQINESQKDTGQWYSTGDSAVIKAAVFRQLNGVMGVGLRLDNNNEGIANPIAQLTRTGSYLIRFPGYGGTSGTVILDPQPMDLYGFQFIRVQQDINVLPNGMNSWQDYALPGTAYLNGVPFPAPTLLDSGNPLVFVDSTYFPKQDSVLRSGNAVVLSVGSPPIANLPFTVVSGLSGKDLVQVNKLTPRKNSFGIQFFFNYDVFYDQKNGIMGLRPHGY